MAISTREFESWCYRNGGETYGREDRPGVACRFPDADIPDRIVYLPRKGVFQVITEGRFYRSRSLHQRADSRIDDRDRLHIDTDDARVVIDPR